MGVKAFEMGLSSVIGVVVFGETMMHMLIAVIIAFVVSTAVTFVLLKSEEVNK
jgi:PTS system beta-glucosides-specific IIC component